MPKFYCPDCSPIPHKSAIPSRCAIHEAAHNPRTLKDVKITFMGKELTDFKADLLMAPNKELTSAMKKEVDKMYQALQLTALPPTFFDDSLTKAMSSLPPEDVFFERESMKNQMYGFKRMFDVPPVKAPRPTYDDTKWPLDCIREMEFISFRINEPKDSSPDDNEWQKLINTLDLRRMPYPTSVRYTPTGDGGIFYYPRHAFLEVQMMVRERNSGRWMNITLRRNITEGQPPSLEFIRRNIHEIYLHELDESIIASNERPFDPHTLHQVVVKMKVEV